MNPSPNAAPTMPIPFARFSGVVESAMKACAVGMLAPAMPGQAARHEQQRQRLRQAERQVRDGRSQQTDQDHRPAADHIGPASPERREQELHQRERRREHPDLECRRAE